MDLFRAVWFGALSNSVWKEKKAKQEDKKCRWVREARFWCSGGFKKKDEWIDPNCHPEFKWTKEN